MLFYVAIVAALNLALGYLWGAYLRPCPRCVRARAASVPLPPLPPTQVIDVRTIAPIATHPDVEVAEATATSDNTSATGTPHVHKSGTPLDPETGLLTRDHAEKLLTKLAEGGTDADPVTVALVEMAPIDWRDEKPMIEVDQRLLYGVSAIVRQSLTGEHTAARYSQQQFLLLVPHEDVEQATRRAEEMRQRVASTEFLVDGRPFQTTVTCALTKASQECVGLKLFEFLEEALAEAKRYGGNRTFMHDGNSPTPVVPPELTIGPQQLAI